MKVVIRPRVIKVAFRQGPRGLPGVTTWDGLAGKPELFPPSAHTHTFSSLEGLPETLAGYGIVDGASVDALEAEFNRASSAEDQLRTDLDAHSHNSDDITEGAANLYYTPTRVANWLLTGVAFATATAITALDPLLTALGKLQAQISAEISARGQADSNLQNAITAEANTRSTNDTNLSTAIGLKANTASPTFTGGVTTPQLIVTVNTSASGSGVRITGSLYTGGTGTTTLPYQLFQPSAATVATTWNTSGTWLGINATSGFSGSFLDFRINGGTALFSVFASGSISMSGSITAGGAITCGAAQVLGIASRGGFRASTDAEWLLRNAANTADGNLTMGTLTLSGNLAVTGTATFAGIPSGPTAAAGTDTTQFSTTAFVQAALAALKSGAQTIAGLWAFTTRPRVSGVPTGNGTEVTTFDDLLAFETDPTKLLFRDDFLTDTGWARYTTGSGVINFGSNDISYFGAVSLITGTTSGSLVGMVAGSSRNLYPYKGKPWRYEVVAKVSAINADFKTRFGFLGAINANPDAFSSGIVFTGWEFDPANSANWQFVKWDGTTAIRVDTGVAAVANLNVRFTMRSTGTDNQCYWSVNGGTETLATGIYDYFVSLNQCIRSTSTNSRSLIVDLQAIACSGVARN